MTLLSDEDQRTILEIYGVTVVDIVEKLEELLVALESSPGEDDLMSEIRRHAHTLKGDAASVGLEQSARLMHAFESVFDGVAAGQMELSPGAASLLLAALDLMRRIASDALSGQPEPVESVDDYEARLARAAEGRMIEALEGMEAPRRIGMDERKTRIGRRREDLQDWRDGARSLRVSTDKLNRILDYTGEVAVAWGRVRELIGGLDLRGNHELGAARDELQRLYLALQEEVMTVRMVPVGPTLRRQIRQTRDLAQRMDKRIAVVIEGEDAELDSTVVAHLSDPLTHLIRNAVDHGVESPAERLAAGKPETATLTLRAVHDTGCIVIEVEDDGRGLDEERLLARVREISGRRDWTPRNRDELLDWIFEPGFSTRDEITDVSGRGVGMDAVRREVERLGGHISVTSQPGRGTRMSLRLPLTLAVITGLEVGVADESYLVPIASVTECVDLEVDQDERIRSRGVMNLRDEPLPYLRLRDFIRADGRAPERENVVVVQHGGQGFGIAVDRVVGERPTVIKPLSGLLRNVPGFAGSTILSSGEVALILDVPALLEVAVAGSDATPSRSGALST